MKLQECPASRDNKALQSDTSAGGHPRVVTENMGDTGFTKALVFVDVLLS